MQWAGVQWCNLNFSFKICFFLSVLLPSLFVWKKYKYNTMNAFEEKLLKCALFPSVQSMALSHPGLGDKSGNWGCIQLSSRLFAQPLSLAIGKECKHSWLKMHWMMSCTNLLTHTEAKHRCLPSFSQHRLFFHRHSWRPVTPNLSLLGAKELVLTSDKE